MAEFDKKGAYNFIEHTYKDRTYGQLIAVRNYYRGQINKKINKQPVQTFFVEKINAMMRNIEEKHFNINVDNSQFNISVVRKKLTSGYNGCKFYTLNMSSYEMLGKIEKEVKIMLDSN